MQVSKWGNSLAIRLPAALVEQLGLKEGDDVVVRRAPDGALEIAQRQAAAETLIERFNKYRGSLPAGYKFDREELYERDTDGKS